MPRWAVLTIEQRFWQKVEKTEDCWLWLASRWGGRGNCQYGAFRTEGTTEYAHRYSYRLHFGPIPEGLTIDHLCRVKLCVRPDHLEAVTGRLNTQRGSPHLVKTHCPQGHPYEGGNLYVRPRGSRECRECLRQKQQQIRDRAKGL